jgi:hypothetical protein
VLYRFSNDKKPLRVQEGHDIVDVEGADNDPGEHSIPFINISLPLSSDPHNWDVDPFVSFGKKVIWI